MIRAKNTKTFGAAPKVAQFHKRRQTPVGEDLKALKSIMREIEGQRIPIEDFILLIAPHTGDKGALLTKIMADDLNNFRKFCNQAYDTMTNDTNEVMAITQVELGQLYAERARLLTVNIINCMKSIHDYIPDFNLEEYNINPDKYLATKFHIIDMPDDEEVDIAKRQLAYHRLNWLQSEGDRLSAENSKLQQRLKELKSIKQKEIADQIAKERDIEAQRIALEQKQVDMQYQLENLVDELLETIVNEEKKVIDEKKGKAVKSLSRRQITSAESRKSSLKRKDSKWSSKAAQEIEISNIQTAAAELLPQSAISASTIRSVPDSTTCRSHLQIPSVSRLRAPRKWPAVSESTREQVPCGKQKAGPTTRKKMSKKPVPLEQRPVWQDVEYNLDEVQATRDMEQTPIDIFAVGRPRATCPTTCSSSGEPQSPRSRIPGQRIGTQAAAPTQPPAQRQGSPCRKDTRPRDTWGGYY